MALHILKLCVGCDSIEDLQSWVDERAARMRAAGQTVEHFHTTRMVPKRVEELLDGGSLYWVIKGGVQCRQKLVDVRPFTDGDGIGRCHLVLDNQLTPTIWQPRRPFQGWRYLRAEDAPQDVGGSSDIREMPAQLRRELADLGLL
jgi:hypothetical protein